MREIKFRAWFKHSYIELSDLRGNRSIYFSPYDLGLITQSIDRKEVVLEQYTGLKDKNGKEIYEGDIIQEKGLLSLTCVEWDKNNARYMTKVLDKSKCVASVFCFDIIDALNCEVIGNIHENPELLEQEDAKG